MKNNIFYCINENGRYLNFFSHLTQIRMCIDLNKETVKSILKCEVVAIEKGDEKNGYWGYWDNEENCFVFVYGCLAILKMCSPDGFRYEIENNQGHISPVEINFIDFDEKDLQALGKYL